MKESLNFELNGRPVHVEMNPDRTLLWVLRTELGSTGTKYGCGISECGACTVLVDGRAVRSCSVDVKSVSGRKVTTIEGLEKEGRLHPLQQAFVAHDALQCGYCIPGMILTAYDLLMRKPDATREDVVAGLDDNLCRCGAHTRIVDAILDASKAMKGLHAP